jgi:hypothetical protein
VYFSLCVFIAVFSIYFVRLTIRYPKPQKIHGQKKNTQTEMGDDEFSFTSVYFNVFFRGRDKILLLCLVFLVNLFTNKTTFATFALSVFSFIAIANNDKNDHENNSSSHARLFSSSCNQKNGRRQGQRSC